MPANSRSNDHKMIGVVGGMGSYAGLDLVRKIYDFSTVDSDQDHLPVSMLSIPHLVEDRSKFLMDESTENPAWAISTIIKLLSDIGAKVIGIPCNTAHTPRIFEQIEKSIPDDCKLINLIEEVGLFIKTNYTELSTVGVLSTNGTFKANVYPDTLSRYHLKVIQPSVEIQTKLVHPAVYHPKYGIKIRANPVSARARKDLKMAVSYLCGQGAQAIILGCTEIPLAIGNDEIENVFIIDATSILAKALIRESTGGA